MFTESFADVRTARILFSCIFEGISIPSPSKFFGNVNNSHSRSLGRGLPIRAWIIS